MEKKKFLTVMAVLDDATQRWMNDVQGIIMEKVGQGTQTMGIPFHITLGSYATDELESVIEKIRAVSESAEPFCVDLCGYSDFNDRVLFLKPQINNMLKVMRSYFECDYANGYDWVPHATIFCGTEEEIKKAKELLREIEPPTRAEIVGIELGEFFPPNKKYSVTFNIRK